MLVLAEHGDQRRHLVEEHVQVLRTEGDGGAVTGGRAGLGAPPQQSWPWGPRRSGFAGGGPAHERVRGFACDGKGSGTDRSDQPRETAVGRPDGDSVLGAAALCWEGNPGAGVPGLLLPAPPPPGARTPAAGRPLPGTFFSSCTT